MAWYNKLLGRNGKPDSVSETPDYAAIDDPKYAETDRIVKGLVIEYMREHHGMEFTEENLHYTHKLVHDIGMDSLDIIEFAMAVEEELDVEIPDKVERSVETVRDVSAYIHDNTDYRTPKK